MDYEKAYKEALERARKLYKDAITLQLEQDIKDYEQIFPELKESEDEKIRKALVRFHKSTIDIDGIKGTDILAWLEKQGDTTSDIRYDGVNAGASLSVVNGKPFDYEHATITQKDFAPKVDMPRYSIGDVLCDKSCTTLDKNSKPNIEILDIRDGMYVCNNCTFPISQQDEYELVAKKIEQNPADNVEQKQEWSEEDENMANDLIKGCVSAEKAYHLVHTSKEIADWLKSLKDRIKGKEDKQ